MAGSAVIAGGRPSVTHYDTLEAFRGASLAEVELETGRTHQIRVHMAALHHPCAGDRQYGADPVFAAHLGLTRQWLHAVRLGFEHPADGHRVEFSSGYPDDLVTPSTCCARKASRGSPVLPSPAAATTPRRNPHV